MAWLTGMLKSGHDCERWNEHSGAFIYCSSEKFCFKLFQGIRRINKREMEVELGVRLGLTELIDRHEVSRITRVLTMPLLLPVLLLR